MKIALIGYGKMGHMIEEIARQRGHEIVSIIDVNNQDDFDSPEFASADVAIEFTNPTAAYGNYLKAFSHGVKVVSGSTGWMKDHKDEVVNLTKDGANTLFWASNFSIGVAIFSAVNRYLAKIMNQFDEYNVCMQETHHVHKLDAPSGTAITLAKDIIDNIDRKKDWKRGVTSKLFVILHHITNIYSVTLVSGVYKNVGNSAYKFTVHNNRTAAHTLNNTARFIK